MCPQYIKDATYPWLNPSLIKNYITTPFNNLSLLRHKYAKNLQSVPHSFLHVQMSSCNILVCVFLTVKNMHIFLLYSHIVSVSWQTDPQWTFSSEIYTDRFSLLCTLNMDCIYVKWWKMEFNKLNEKGNAVALLSFYCNSLL